MIEKVTAYKSSTGQTFGTLEEVQRHEIEQILLAACGPPREAVKTDIQIDVAAKSIVDNKAVIEDILTTGPRSKPKARSINGGRKQRTPKVPVVDSSKSA